MEFELTSGLTFYKIIPSGKAGVEEAFTSDTDRVGFLKSVQKGGPVGANEYIASLIGEMLELPVAKIRFHLTENGMKYLSYDLKLTSLFEPNLPDPMLIQGPSTFFIDPTIFMKLMIFDIFINNRDRHKGNIGYVARDNGKYQLALFDHENTCFGASPTPPADPLTMSEISLIEEVKIPERKSLFVLPYVEKSPEFLNRIVNIDFELISSAITKMAEFDASILTIEQGESMLNVLKARSSAIVSLSQGHLQ